ncbi:MAG TPA: hypothetical protein VN457_03390, partial [Chlamydiales bacterium]|nr:hypothetical protein [Chlamydiales bacterium]
MVFYSPDPTPEELFSMFFGGDMARFRQRDRSYYSYADIPGENLRYENASAQNNPSIPPLGASAQGIRVAIRDDAPDDLIFRIAMTLIGASTFCVTKYAMTQMALRSIVLITSGLWSAFWATRVITHFFPTADHALTALTQKLQDVSIACICTIGEMFSTVAVFSIDAIIWLRDAAQSAIVLVAQVIFSCCKGVAAVVNEIGEWIFGDRDVWVEQFKNWLAHRNIAFVICMLDLNTHELGDWIDLSREYRKEILQSLNERYGAENERIRLFASCDWVANYNTWWSSWTSSTDTLENGFHPFIEKKDKEMAIYIAVLESQPDSRTWAIEKAQFVHLYKMMLTIEKELELGNWQRSYNALEMIPGTQHNIAFRILRARNPARTAQLERSYQSYIHRKNNRHAQNRATHTTGNNRQQDQSIISAITQKFDADVRAQFMHIIDNYYANSKQCLAYTFNQALTLLGAEN